MGKNYALNINISSENYRIHLSDHQKSNPLNAFNFCMALRKHLIGGTINKIYMNDLERIVYIDISCYNELNDLTSKTLIVELMGKHSNIILVNENKTIIDSLRHLNQLDNSIRNILPGEKYIGIDNKKSSFIKTSFDNFYNNLINSNNKLSNSISNEYIGLSKLGIQFILDILSISDSTSILLDEYKKIYNYLHDLIKSNCFIPSIYNDNYYIELKDIKSDLSLNFFIDDFYFERETIQNIKNEKNRLLSIILLKMQKLKSKLDKINITLSECSKMDTYKLYGELITANLYKISNFNQENIELKNYYNNNELIKINLDPSISPSLNAKKFFKKYKKLHNALEISKKQKDLLENEISYLDNIVHEIMNTSNISDLAEFNNELTNYLNISSTSSQSVNSKKKSANSLFPTEYSIDGYTVLVGKNNKQNDYLTTKMAKSSDLWFHTKDIHGSHVVLKLPKNLKQLPDSIIYKCATIASFFSKAKMSQNVPVDYTFIKYVKKPNSAKPGMVIYTDNKTLYVNPKNPLDYK